MILMPLPVDPAMLPINMQQKQDQLGEKAGHFS